MIYYAKSYEILKKSAYVSEYLDGEIKKFKSNIQFKSNSDIIIGWGLKPNSLKLKKISQQKNINFLHLEDGFISYINTLDFKKKGIPISLVTDKTGIYYQSKSPCDLERFILQPLNQEQENRITDIIKEIKKYGLTKYNFFSYVGENKRISGNFSFLKNKAYVLLVDQVSGDLSIDGADACENDFYQMIIQAKQFYPECKIIIKSHPDTLNGKKKGVLIDLVKKHNIKDVILCQTKLHPHSLIHYAKAVFTVSSQLGFEALILGNKVYCFGMPFYAGWGLTIDSKICERRKQLKINQNISLNQLCYASLIRYAKYYNPVTKSKCEIEAIIHLIKNQIHEYPNFEKLYFVGFTFWKRPFIPFFIKQLTNTVKFKNKISPLFITKLLPTEKILVWGNAYPQFKNIIRAEDGFIRSSDLGSNLCIPNSLVFDDLGIYFDSTKVSRIEHNLNHISLSKQEYSKACHLLEILKQKKVSKYNLHYDECYKPPKRKKHIILVIGQVEGDASIVYGSPVIKTNTKLLNVVREANKSSWIIYKPHPDVVSKNRSGGICGTAKQYYDEMLSNTSLVSLFEHIDELHTMTSLSGFEALIQGVKVICWGQPFYSGWGLTIDKYPCTRRTRKLDLPTLVFHALHYPTYIDWETKLFISPHEMIELIAKQPKGRVNNLKFRSLSLKIAYVVNSLKLTLPKVWLKPWALKKIRDR